MQELSFQHPIKGVLELFQDKINEIVQWINHKAGADVELRNRVLNRVRALERALVREPNDMAYNIKDLLTRDQEEYEEEQEDKLIDKLIKVIQTGIKLQRAKISKQSFSHHFIYQGTKGIVTFIAAPAGGYDMDIQIRVYPGPKSRDNTPHTS